MILFGLRKWAINVLIAIDQLGNALTLGDPDETISSRLGRLKRDNGGAVPRSAWLYLARPLDATLDWIDPNHSIDAIEENRCAKESKPNWPKQG